MNFFMNGWLGQVDETARVGQPGVVALVALGHVAGQFPGVGQTDVDGAGGQPGRPGLVVVLVRHGGEVDLHVRVLLGEGVIDGLEAGVRSGGARDQDVEVALHLDGVGGHRGRAPGDDPEQPANVSAAASKRVTRRATFEPRPVSDVDGDMVPPIPYRRTTRHSRT